MNKHLPAALEESNRGGQKHRAREGAAAMTPTEVAAKLRAFNDWRRGGDIEQPDPLAVGEAIDEAVEIVKKHEAIFYAIELLWYEHGLDLLGASFSSFMIDVRAALEESK